eukprot:scaffold74194_cov66-Phaeocystis_antarctica.AAC.2
MPHGNQQADAFDLLLMKPHCLVTTGRLCVFLFGTRTASSEGMKVVPCALISLHLRVDSDAAPKAEGVGHVQQRGHIGVDEPLHLLHTRHPVVVEHERAAE